MGKVISFVIHEKSNRPGEFLMALQLTDSQDCTFSIAGTDAAGQPATFENDSFTVNSTDAAIASASINPDGTGTIVSGAPGTATISIVDTEPDASTVELTFDVNVVAGEAKSLAVMFGSPTEKAPTA